MDCATRSCRRRFSLRAERKQSLSATLSMRVCDFFKHRRQKRLEDRRLTDNDYAIISLSSSLSIGTFLSDRRPRRWSSDSQAPPPHFADRSVLSKLNLASGPPPLAYVHQRPRARSSHWDSLNQGKRPDFYEPSQTQPLPKIRWPSITSTPRYFDPAADGFTRRPQAFWRPTSATARPGLGVDLRFPLRRATRSTDARSPGFEVAGPDFEPSCTQRPHSVPRAEPPRLATDQQPHPPLPLLHDLLALLDDSHHAFAGLGTGRHPKFLEALLDALHLPFGLLKTE
jgi:hypothetical protein